MIAARLAQPHMSNAARRRVSVLAPILLSLALALAAPGTGLCAQGGMAVDVLDSFTKSPSKRQTESRNAPVSQTGPVAPTPPKAPVVPGASAQPFDSSQPPLRQQTTQARHLAPPRAAPKAGPRLQQLTLTVDGQERRAILALPKAAPAKKGQAAPKLPLVIFLHGAGGSASQAMRQTNLAERATAAGFLAVFPEGLGPPGGNGEGQTWNAWMCCGYARDQRVDDLSFLSALMGRLKADFGADPRRVYLAGFSNGAMLASRFALERPGVAAALVSVAGYLPCDAEAPTAPLPVLVIHGDRDGVARFGPTAAHPATGRYCEDYPARAQVDFWVRGMNLSPKAQVQDAKKSPARVEEYGPAKKGGRALVRFVIAKGGGHAWPGGTRERYRYCDLPTAGVDATGLMLNFFRNASAPAPAKETVKEAAKIPAKPAKKRRAAQ